MSIVRGTRGRILGVATRLDPQPKVQELRILVWVGGGGLNLVDRMAGRPCTIGSTVLISEVANRMGVDGTHLARTDFIEGHESERLC